MFVSPDYIWNREYLQTMLLADSDAAVPRDRLRAAGCLRECCKVGLALSHRSNYKFKNRQRCDGCGPRCDICGSYSSYQVKLKVTVWGVRGDCREKFEDSCTMQTYRDVEPVGRVHETAVSNSRLQSTAVPLVEHATPEHEADVI